MSFQALIEGDMHLRLALGPVRGAAVWAKAAQLPATPPPDAAAAEHPVRPEPPAEPSFLQRYGPILGAGGLGLLGGAGLALWQNRKKKEEEAVKGARLIKRADPAEELLRQRLNARPADVQTAAPPEFIQQLDPTNPYAQKVVYGGLGLGLTPSLAALGLLGGGLYGGATSRPGHGLKDVSRGAVRGAGTGLGAGLGAATAGALTGDPLVTLLGAGAGGLGGNYLSRLALGPREEEPEQKAAKDLSPGSKARKHVAKKDFVYKKKSPKGTHEKSKYPVPDLRHARAALGFAAMHHGHGKEYQAVKRKVHAKFPNLGKKSAAVLKRADVGDWLQRNVGQPAQDYAHQLGESFGSGARSGAVGGEGGVGGFLDHNPWANWAAWGLPIGAGVGLLGGLMNRKKKKDALGDALTGGLLGAAAGGLGRYAYGLLPQRGEVAGEPTPPAAAPNNLSQIPGAPAPRDLTKPDQPVNPLRRAQSVGNAFSRSSDVLRNQVERTVPILDSAETLRHSALQTGNNADANEIARAYGSVGDALQEANKSKDYSAVGRELGQLGRVGQLYQEAYTRDEPGALLRNANPAAAVAGFPGVVGAAQTAQSGARAVGPVLDKAMGGFDPNAPTGLGPSDVPWYARPFRTPGGRDVLAGSTAAAATRGLVSKGLERFRNSGDLVKRDARALEQYYNRFGTDKPPTVTTTTKGETPGLFRRLLGGTARALNPLGGVSPPEGSVIPKAVTPGMAATRNPLLERVTNVLNEARTPVVGPPRSPELPIVPPAVPRPVRTEQVANALRGEKGGVPVADLKDALGRVARGGGGNAAYAPPAPPPLGKRLGGALVSPFHPRNLLIGGMLAAGRHAGRTAQPNALVDPFLGGR